MSSTPETSRLLMYAERVAEKVGAASGFDTDSGIFDFFSTCATSRCWRNRVPAAACFGMTGHVLPEGWPRDQSGEIAPEVLFLFNRSNIFRIGNPQVAARMLLSEDGSAACGEATRMSASMSLR